MGYLATYQRLHHLYGAASATYILGASVFRRMGYLRYACYARDSVPPAHHSAPHGFSLRRVEADEIRKWAKSPEMDMTEDFVKALREGIDCAIAAYAPHDPDQLPAAYAFLSRGSTAVDQYMTLGIPAGSSYIYKAYTRDAYRGLGLNKACCTALLNRPEAEQGPTFALIEATNVSSRRSFEAIGFVTKGAILTWSNGIHAKLTPRATKAGLRLVSG